MDSTLVFAFSLFGILLFAQIDISEFLNGSGEPSFQALCRMGRNPQTGEEIKIAAKTTVKFRIAKAASDAIAPPKA